MEGRGEQGQPGLASMRRLQIAERDTSGSRRVAIPQRP